MTMRCVAIRLKIPDNQAYTALTTLQRLNLEVARVDRAEIWVLNDAGEAADFLARVERNETLFNPNKHVLHVLEERVPREGEVWIEEMDQDDGDDLRRLGRPVAGVIGGKRYIGWRLFDDGGAAPRTTVMQAVEQLLCNPAIERAIIR
ncbi:MAG TPA: hypothetical protein VFE17_03515 [Candidatus Baltobacteraceae bacterium]|jgi:phosphoribosylformylglycinamidine (FGAM) synthase PurS component|nr:hypothetical protein [Candidatus Baltobacteraceae bacterium]